ncbi:alpha/beta hydrolase [Gordonia sp. (in: high G+C Gram-positive bacteria)]|uniref:alpha/beta hydrolase n=1 Tax=Gordonia sp. (in: high G+C Gram-positive bacteria) TaxID=84139 RepID=UPI0016AABE44|nr:alpha/beta hydrolase [Gordonia sp. (in: high G+C Gram-positive bacteria)]NLG48332.1 alpha/beta hydrolase [Gordonia sp. (in: high G+C Gram-positive bacteria)]
MTLLIVMPGTGSDADYAARAFGPAAASLGARLIALEPESDLFTGYQRRLDELAATDAEFFVGGVSIGAAIAAAWTIRSPSADRCRGVLAALPPWSGEVGDSLAALSAQITADAIERDGLEPTIEQMSATSPPWLAAELTRSWRSLADRGLVEQLRAAATYPAPTVRDMARLPVPLGVAAAPDDPLHPIEVGRAWTRAAPRGALREVPLTEFGPAAHRLGDACLAAWREAAGPDA